MKSMCAAEFMLWVQRSGSRTRATYVEVKSTSRIMAMPATHSGTGYQSRVRISFKSSLFGETRRQHEADEDVNTYEVAIHNDAAVFMDE